MAPSKLSDNEKHNITRLYCQPGETTATLAEKFGVSSSTVSRVLKQLLSEEDYSQLAQWKRSGERGNLELSFTTHEEAAPSSKAEPAPPPSQETAPDNTVPDTVPAEQPTASDAESLVEPALESPADTQAESPTSGKIAPEADAATDIDTDSEIDAEATVAPLPEIAPPRETPPVLKRRSQRQDTTPAETETSHDDDEQLPLQFTSSKPGPVLANRDSTTAEAATGDDDEIPDVTMASDWDADDLDQTDDYDDTDDDYDDDLDDDDDLDEWDDDTSGRDVTPHPSQEQLEILPFDTLVLERPCYLVVDRLSELITCPLKEFSELGIIPEEECQARTLPVFDNHRVARRFSRRNQRIVKVPSGKMLTKTQPYLQAKGITRLLFDGQVYALT